jgi:hypothetical protein
MDEGKQAPKRIVSLPDELRSRLATWAIEGYPRETCTVLSDTGERYVSTGMRKR